MRLRILLIAVLMAMFVVPSVQSAPYSNAISINPFALVWSWVDITYETQLSPTNSLTIFGSFYSSGWWTSYGIGASYRWYLDLFKDGKSPIEGFSVGPRAAVNWWSWDNYYGYIGDNDNHIGFAIGGEAGYKWVWGGFMVEPLITLMFGSNDYGSWGGVNVGYAW